MHLLRKWMMLKRVTYTRPSWIELVPQRVGRRYTDSEVLLRSSMESVRLQILVLVAITHKRFLCGLKWRMVPWEQQLATGQSDPSRSSVTLTKDVSRSGCRKVVLASIYSFCENRTGLDNPVHVRGDLSRETVEALGDTLCTSRRSLLFFLTSLTKTTF